METLLGTVNKILFTNNNGFKVLRVKLNSGPIIIITGEFGPEMITGTIANFHGDHKTHPKYGNNFKAYSYSVEYDAHEINSIKLFIDAIAPNIGPERSEMIIGHFGKDTLNVLDNEPQRLKEVHGIGDVLSEVIITSWTNNRERWKRVRAEYSLRAFLNSIGLKERRIKRVLNHFGGGLSAEETIRENPYILMDIEGFGFSTVDFIAKSIGIKEDSPDRLTAFILYALKDLSKSYGHLFLRNAELLALIISYIAQSGVCFIGKSILNEEDIKHSIEELIAKEMVIRENDYIYHRSSYFYEVHSAQALCKILRKPSDLIFLTRETVEKRIEVFERENRITLSPEQRDALHYFIEHKCFIITGLPGTGKSSIIKALVELIKELRLSLTCMAPTGIAAKKLATSINYPASTIHRQLKCRGGNNWEYNESSPFETDIAIVDEASMIDMEVFYHLLAALKDRTHLIFVGDDNQLPSVGAGNVLKELINCGKIPVIRLERIFRQDEASDIIKAAHRIKSGNTDLSFFKSDPQSDIFFYRENKIEKIEELTIKLAAKFKKEKRLFQIITPRNTGPLSVDGLNPVLQEALNPGHEIEKSFGKFIVKKGDRVIIVKNDYELGVFNGDIGKVTLITNNSLIIDLEDKSVEIGMEDILEKIRLAYILTVHKCLPEYTQLYSPSGLIPIGDIKKGETVNTSISESPVEDIYDTGFKDVYKIKTRTGRILKCSSEHLNYIADEKGMKFLKTSEIIPGMFYCLSKKGYSGRPQKISHSNNSHNKRVGITLPETIDEDMAWLISFMIGNGCYTDKKDGIIEVSSPTSPELLNEFQRICESYGLKVKDHLREGKIYCKYICNKNFREWLLSIGIDYVTAPYKSIPKIIFNSPENIRCAFIGGFLAKGRAMMRYTTASEVLCDNLMLLFLSLGIVSYKSVEGPRHFKVNVSGPDFNILRKKARIKDIKRKKFYASVQTSGTKTNLHIIPFGKALIEDFILKAKVGLGKSQGIKGKGFQNLDSKLYNKIIAISNGYNKLRNPILEDIKLFSLENRIPINPIIDEILEKGIYYDEIIEVVKLPEKEKMVEIGVKGSDHTYIAEGFICHNCQGSEFPIVILPFINQFGKNMLQRNLLYTAITRAREKVIVIGHGSAIERAINNASVSKRNTILGERICQNLEIVKNISLPQQPCQSQGCPPLESEEVPF